MSSVPPVPGGALPETTPSAGSFGSARTEPERSPSPKISVVVPVYRSEATLRELHRRLSETLRSLSEWYEIVFVEDGGRDGSWKVIESLCSSDPCVRGIRLSRNFGQHAATICGISRANGEWIVTLDDDLEHGPELIPDLFRKAEEGHSLVYGVYPNRSHKGWRNVASAIGRRLFTLAIPSLNHDYTSFRLIARPVASKLADFDSPFPFVDGYLSWITNDYATVIVPHRQRTSGESNYDLRKLFVHSVNIFVTFSDLPLRLASWLGLGTFALGMAWLAFVLVRFFVGGIGVSGYASLMGGIVLFGGLQLLILGIFGEYLGRMNFKSSRKPLFLVADDTGSRSRSAGLSSP